MRHGVQGAMVNSFGFQTSARLRAYQIRDIGKTMPHPGRRETGASTHEVQETHIFKH